MVTLFLHVSVFHSMGASVDDTPLSSSKNRKPDIVIIVADDLGYGDVGFHGSDILTPHLDELADKGIKLEEFYVAPMCSPTRAGVMTGRYPIRFGMMRSVVPPHRNFGMDPQEQTLPETLQLAGYQYRAAIGKWHLGHLQKKWHPNEQGFTHFVGCYNGAIDYFTHERNSELDWHRNEESYHIEGYSTDIIAAEACKFIESVPSNEPYFLYVPFNAPHSPFQAKESDIGKYDHRKGNRRIYAAMVDCMDQGIGRILEAIEKRGNLQNTLVLFFSDNGGVKGIGDNGGMRGHKLTVFQGGIRVAALAYWPEGGWIGGKTVDERMGYIDIHPTIAKIVGVEPLSANPFDGIDVMDALSHGADLPNRAWFTYMDQGNEKIEHIAVNYDEVKKIVERPAPDAVGHGSATTYLFCIDDDPSERVDLSAELPGVAKKLQSDVEVFLSLKAEPQIDRYFVGRKGFVAPLEWQIDE